MTSKRPFLIAALAVTLMLGVLAIPAQAALRHLDGTVVSKNPENRTFRISTQSGNKVRIEVNGATQFERIAGFGALHKGMRIQVDAQLTGSGLVAKKVEPQGSGGGGGADGPNHT